MYQYQCGDFIRRPTLKVLVATPVGMGHAFRLVNDIELFGERFKCFYNVCCKS